MARFASLLYTGSCGGETRTREGVVTAETRHDRIERAISLLVDHQDALVAAMRDDFGHRSETQSLFTDIAGSIGPLRHAQKHLKIACKLEMTLKVFSS